MLSPFVSRINFSCSACLFCLIGCGLKMFIDANKTCNLLFSIDACLFCLALTPSWRCVVDIWDLLAQGVALLALGVALCLTRPCPCHKYIHCFRLSAFVCAHYGDEVRNFIQLLVTNSMNDKCMFWIFPATFLYVCGLICCVLMQKSRVYEEKYWGRGSWCWAAM
jgi:hypothetical protein